MTISIRRLVPLVAAGALALSAAACGSGQPGGSADQGSAAGAEGVKAAQAFLDGYSRNPASIGITEALPAKPSPGKTIVALTIPLPESARLAAAEAAAAKVLGWNFVEVSTGTTPGQAVGAFEAALARHPDAITFNGLPSRTFTAQIKRAKAEGIAVLSESTGDGKVDGVLADLGGLAQEQLYGKMLAAYFVAHSGGKGSAGVVNLAAYPALIAFGDSFAAAVKQWCPACRTQTLNQQATDAGTKTPANVVAFLQRNPSVKWTVFANGDLAQGVSSAIKASGLTGVNIIGEVPGQTDLASLGPGTEQGWAGFAVDILGWRAIDVLARQFAGADLNKVLTVPLPAQMITKDNVDSVVLGTQDYYIGVKDYQSQFAALWHAGR